MSFLKTNYFCSQAKNFLNVWKKRTILNQLSYFSSDVDLGSLTNEEDKYFKAERCINEVKLLGRVGKDPVKSLYNGKPYVKFSLATNNIYKSQDDDLREKTSWHTVISYDPHFVKYVEDFIKKGLRVLVTGKLSYFTPTDSPNSKVAFIQLQDIIFLGSPDN